MVEIQIAYGQDEPRATSLSIAETLGIQHKNLLENIDKYSEELQQLSPLAFETRKGIALKTGGFAKDTRIAMLTEDQCYFVLTLSRNTPQAVQAKLSLVKAFREARNNVVAQEMARIDGKKARKLETDAISKLVKYATDKGSKNAKWYFATITKMTNGILGLVKGQRDSLDADTLRRVAAVEQIVEFAINDGIAAGLHHKDIYKLAKDRAELVAPALFRTLKEI